MMSSASLEKKRFERFSVAIAIGISLLSMDLRNIEDMQTIALMEQACVNVATITVQKAA